MIDPLLVYSTVVTLALVVVYIFRRRQALIDANARIEKLDRDLSESNMYVVQLETFMQPRDTSR